MDKNMKKTGGFGNKSALLSLQIPSLMRICFIEISRRLWRIVAKR